MFLKGHPRSIFIALVIYVDDILLISNKDDQLPLIKQELSKKFKMHDLGAPRFFLGIETTRSRDGINLMQRKYALDILTDMRLLGCRPMSTPMEPNAQLSKLDGVFLGDPTTYSKLIDKLLYLTITRPDLSFAVNLF